MSFLNNLYRLIKFIYNRLNNTNILNTNKCNKYINKDMKILFIVNTDLKMGKGKIISQCIHAYDGILDYIQYNDINMYYKNKKINNNIQNNNNVNSLNYIKYSAWKYNGCAKIVVKGTTEDIININNKLQYNVLHYMVTDAGRTQIAPNSKTVLAIGPEESEIIDEYCKHLKLL